MAEKKNSVMKDVVLSNNAFALKLFSKIEGGEETDNRSPCNVFFSPCSLSLALAMVYSGARGTTAEEMSAFFSWDPSTIHEGMRAMRSSLTDAKKSDQPGAITVANRTWLQEGFPVLEEFTQTLTTYYGSSTGLVDFQSEAEAARQLINKWVEDQTMDKIKELIKPGVLAATTRLVLTNAIYFKGEWASKFDAKQTKPGDFHLGRDDEIVQVDTMYVSSRFRYGKIKGPLTTYESLLLPYADRKFSMLILLPDRNTNVGELVGRLSEEHGGDWKAMAGGREVAEAAVEAYIPKFKLEYQFDACGMMQSMGVVSLFDQSNADLSGINGKKDDLFVSHVIHKAFVDVDEKGTTAAAATAVAIMTRCAVRPVQKILFKADRPFAFFIVDNYSQGIVFGGKLGDPR